MTNNKLLCRIIYCSLTDLHVSSDIFAHHQEPTVVWDELELSSNSSMTTAGYDISE